MKKQFAVGAGLVLLGLTGTARAQPVNVAPGFAEPALPPYEIMSIVRSTGLTPLTRPMRRGPNYILVAVDRAGRQMQVAVDARLGDIVNLHPAVAAGSYGSGPYGSSPYGSSPYGSGPYGAGPYGAPPPGPGPYGQAMAPPAAPPAIAAAPPESVPLPPTSGPRPAAASRATVDGAPPPTPPRAVPNTKVANAPSALVPNIPDPPAPPLPRPRPKLASNDSPAEVPAAPPAPAASPAPPPAAPQQPGAAQIE